MAATKKTFMSSADFESSDDKLKALEAAKLQIEKQFGKGSLMKLGEKQSMNEAGHEP